MTNRKRPPLPHLPHLRLAGQPLTAARLVAMAAGLPLRGKVIGWLFMFITAYRSGLPVIYSAALAAVPWLLLPPTDKK
jgi:hypothetical protein